MNKDRKLKRRLNHLIYNYLFRGSDPFAISNPIMDEMNELFKKLNIFDKHSYVFCRPTARRRYYRKYDSSPKPERKDNKTYINFGSGSSGSSMIRYPSKKRKTAWKRFYKLFPHLKNE
jgi:hypothetical protein